MQTQHARALRAAFDSNASHYDEERRLLIPCYDEFYGTAVRAASSGWPGPVRVLDLGTGTGLFARLLAGLLPGADFTLVDLSPEMLAATRERLAALQTGQVHLLEANYCDEDFREQLPHASFDLVVSSLSIHHLENEDKARLFQVVRSLLHSGGRFVNADQVAGTDEYFVNLAENWYRQDIEASALPPESIAASYARRALDRNATVDFQLAALRDARFAHADLLYRNGFFGVFVATVS